MASQFEFGKYCTPAQLYLVLAVLGLIMTFVQNFRLLTLIVNGFFVVIWAWILNWLCRKGFTAISWILVLLPFIMFAAAFFLAIEAADIKDGKNPAVSKVAEAFGM